MFLHSHACGAQTSTNHFLVRHCAYLFIIWCNNVIRYYTNQSLKMAFEMAPADPTVDLNMQL